MFNDLLVYETFIDLSCSFSTVVLVMRVMGKNQYLSITDVTCSSS